MIMISFPYWYRLLHGEAEGILVIMLLGSSFTLHSRNLLYAMRYYYFLFHLIPSLFNIRSLHVLCSKPLKAH